MHDEILDHKQSELLKLINQFKSQFGLVGGTAIALHLGHRRSIDFDLFTLNDFETDEIKKVIRKNNQIQTVFMEQPNQLTVLVNDVKITFYKYPFNIKFKISYQDIINIPDLITLASMKAYALGKRAKWKDYVDLYFILQQIPLSNIIDKTNKLYLNEFNQKLFREELAYFKNIDYTEEVDYLKGFEKSQKKIKEYLIKASLQK